MTQTQNGKIMEKIRTLNIDGYEVQVSNHRGVINSGKFYGEWPHAVREYPPEYHDANFGDCSEWHGYYWRVQKNGSGDLPSSSQIAFGYRYFREDDQGFVTEISADDYANAERAYTAHCERADGAYTQ